MSTYSDIAKEIANDIIKSEKKKMQKAIRYVAQQTRDDWEDIAQRVMDNYYRDYESDAYDRTYQLQNIIAPVYGFKRKDNCYVAGVEFDYSRMDHGTLPKFREYDIFENFVYGAHGNEDYTNPKTGKPLVRDIHFTSPHARSVLDKYYASYDAQIDRFWKAALSLI